ncbi:MAG: 5'-methylthioadenosine/S-adenosylhomocysteine nucleosidase [Acidaminococcus sp.]|jgi:adenosylhomocysteine nucleosidase|nr:5'-methylthioadenosine/S-adenosylhomocysteine nucleosidase [Acidaminococcus sp.]MCI2100305.1 5'-methylthioadenosine/S-adenosylhomocysteine nucleosidase [Acidaminococcus sp.]MCI2114619.1 5'-methylthioadenosine/S-adenosylhomocysteine nucleosidase [Acidaminococcus sp.]MCI2116602.1 5'-methylthioadenosine/S-adenosylhomocysteine nucleosidase [Acidaminococcus sp.]
MEKLINMPAFLSGGPVLLQGAMELEVAPYLARLTKPQKSVMGDFLFWQGKLGRVPVVISQTGIGTAAAGAATALGCQVFHPTAVLNQGTAGGYGLDARVGDIVIGETVYNGNALYTGDGHTRYMDLGRIEHESVAASIFPEKPPLMHADAGMTSWLKKGLSNYLGGNVLIGTIASSDEWNADPAVIARRVEATGALCEEMEAAAVLMTAKRFNVPCGLIRILSNNNRTGLPFDSSVCETLAEALSKSLGLA